MDKNKQYTSYTTGQQKSCLVQRFTLFVKGLLIVFVCFSVFVVLGGSGFAGSSASLPSGGEENLNKRFRPFYGEKLPIKTWVEVEPQAKWAIQTLTIALQKQTYLYGSWSNGNWWMGSDIDLCVTEKISDIDKRIAKGLGNQFKVNFELTTCNKTRKTIKCEVSY